MTRYSLIALVCLAPGWIPILGQTVPPVASRPSAPAASLHYAPPLVVGVGAGFLVPSGGGTVAYQQVSGYVGSGTYATTVNEYSLIHGALVNCALAGMSIIKYQPGPFSFGATGLAGGCEAANGNADGAGSAQVFSAWHIAQSPFSLLVTGRKTWLANGKQAAKVTLGLIYAWGK